MATTSNSYTGNNSTVDYSFTFPYLKSSDIKVSVDEVLQDLTTHYTLHNATTIRFGTAPATGKAIKIYRDTASAQLAATFYPGSAIRSSDLNDNYTQNLYVTQEAENDAATSLTNSRVLEGGAYVSAISKATTAISTSNTASTNASNAVTTANTASTNASNAVSTANTASTNASNAVTTANAADTKADAATTTANTASTNATNATNTANTAATNATSAVSTANTASTNATNAVSTANTASTNASNAVTTANAAETTANASAATVANSAIYQVVANYAALPALASVDNGKFYQVNDSTGIESQSAVTGEPSNYQGDNELTVKLKSNTTASPKVWEWQEYYANDPETRYRKKLIVENKVNIDEDYTITTDNNAFSVGTVTLANTKTITVPANSTYFIG